MSDLPEWERVEGWGLSTRSRCRVVRPRDAEQVAEAFALAREHGWSVGPRGAGRSYGDASQNDGNLVLDFTEWDGVAFDAESGVARVQPGATVRDLWSAAVPHGWWPYVVSGTMTPTLGGAAAMNIHGKNAFSVGTIGDHIHSFRLLTPTGEDLRCSRDERPELFHAAIGGFGALGVMHDIEIETKFVDSGRLEVTGTMYDSLGSMMEAFEGFTKDADYCVGWVDSFGWGGTPGRGQIHTARYLTADEDPDGIAVRPVDRQQLPTTILGVPKGLLWRPGRIWMALGGMPLVNVAKFYKDWWTNPGPQTHRKSHAAFHFLLDFVPNWKKVHGRGGLIQFQPFVPHEHAHDVFERLIRMQHDEGIVNWLTVLKRHRPDPFLLTHGLDGWSLAMDFNVTDRNRGRLWRLCHRMAEVVIEHGGRFYPAKDATLTADQFQRALGQSAISGFRALKQEVDPDGVLQTNLSRRLLG